MEAASGGGLSAAAGLYYEIQRLCLGALSTAAPIERIALYCVAGLAAEMAQRLDGEAVEEIAEQHWRDRASALAGALRLTRQGRSLQEIIWRLSAIVMINRSSP